MKSPVLLAIAGPNGSGKSTVATKDVIIGIYVNADDIMRALGCTPLEAAKIAEKTRETLLSERKNFTFETVLSTSRNLNLMARAREAGYNVICIYVLTTDPKINIARVEERKNRGGHDVPTEKIVTRYYRALKLFPLLFDVCDELYVFDNSSDRSSGSPRMILYKQNGGIILIPNDTWTVKMLESLCEGAYLPNYD